MGTVSCRGPLRGPSIALERHGRSGAAGEASGRTDPEVVDEPPGEPICCAVCGHALTTTRARVEIGGSHTHTFMNPAGLVFTIGCFARAPGCRGTGEASTEWSWFEGAAWRVALCGRCGSHVGWSFSREASSFHGLILERIIGSPGC